MNHIVLILIYFTCTCNGRRVNQLANAADANRMEERSNIIGKFNPAAAVSHSRSRMHSAARLDPSVPVMRRMTPVRMEDALAKAEASTTEEEVAFKGAEQWSKSIAEPKAVFDILKVKGILPHRYPFLLVDKVIEFVPGKKAVGIKKVTANEEFFNGHFPERPIMPGVLQLEAMAQVGGIIALQEPITNGEGDFFFAGVNNVKWRRPVVPGDTLVMEMEMTAFKPRFGLVKMKGASFVDGLKVVEGEFQFAMIK